jgi:TatD DNase family protein
VKSQVAPLVDSHCHIDLYPDPIAIISEVETARVYTIALTNTPSVFPMTEQLVFGKRYLRPALGLHPELASERVGELPLFERYLPKTRYVGEIGLDYVTQNGADRKTQQYVFERILELCHQAQGKVVTVHSRRAAADVVDMIPNNFSGTIILHWYSGSQKMLRRAIEKGCYMSFNLAMMRSAKSKQLLHHVPLERILTESDGPFVSYRETVSTPLHMLNVVEQMARELSVPVDNMRQQVYDNFYRLLKY